MLQEYMLENEHLRYDTIHYPSIDPSSLWPPFPPSVLPSPCSFRSPLPAVPPSLRPPMYSLASFTLPCFCLGSLNFVLTKSVESVLQEFRLHWNNKHWRVSWTILYHVYCQCLSLVDRNKAYILWFAVKTWNWFAWFFSPRTTNVELVQSREEVSRQQTVSSSDVYFDTSLAVIQGFFS